MPIHDILNSYEEVKDDLKFHSMSSVRTKIMISLSDGPKKSSELTKLTGIESSAILQGINELKKENLILSEKDYHYLSKNEIKPVSDLIDMIKTLVVLKNNRELWLYHEIDSIPPDLLKKIGDLSNSELIESKNLDISKVHDTHTQIVLKAEKIKGVSPIFYSDYIKTFNKVLKRGVNVELILTDAVLRKTIESHDPESLENIKRLISGKQLKIWKLNEDVKVAFTVTDKAITLGLSSINGVHDSTKNLVSDHEDAIAWGNELFDYYSKKAQKVNLNDLKNF